MTKIMRTIFEYAREEVIPSYLASHTYEVCREAGEAREEMLLQSLPPTEREQMEEYFNDVSRRASMEMEAAFLAGLSLGLELFRL